MSGKLEMQVCFNCGKEIGVFQAIHGEPEICGDLECQNELRLFYAERAEIERQRDESLGYLGHY